MLVVIDSTRIKQNQRFYPAKAECARVNVDKLLFGLPDGVLQ